MTGGPKAVLVLCRMRMNLDDPIVEICSGEIDG
jgi:hypothetical protein